MKNRSNIADYPLVDVVALSAQDCEHPIKAKLAYAGQDNFIGRIVNGYDALASDFALMSLKAAQALCKVQDELITHYNLRLLICDAYRPQRAVQDFMHWMKQPPAHNSQGQHELVMKEIHYPHIKKDQLFDLHYLAEDSQHCYGNTVDLILIDSHGTELDMGTRFDYMDELSHVEAPLEKIGETAFLNRKILSTAMQRFGFSPYAYEFWHYSFLPREYDIALDIAITPDLKNRLL